MNAERADCIVVGAGPAGLTAALYMARYRRRVLVLHDVSARALRIPLTHNAPGFPGGISGPDLIARMTRHAESYGASVREACIVKAMHDGEIFRVQSQTGENWHARTLILATGLHLNQIPLEHGVHEAAIRSGVLRYCPICDAYEHTDRKIGVIGCDTQGGNEAMFLRRYTDDITLIPCSYADLSERERKSLTDAGIRIVRQAAAKYTASGDSLSVELANGERLIFDVVYPALGVRPRTELAEALGLATDDSGCLDPQTPFETQIPGLYSAGDIVEGLDQINVAISHGAIAATKAHNWLRELDGECLPTDAGH
ncbi:NAD(P)/FAD-dependent oxidoreductase [Sphingobium yanoikuyae]|jgi:thioredoxin reductase (NADPH)|uniref:NAD(P)/FAD-dependent oxidoreductase n=1 Tax=Sphingobium yanoikuyae TaxID=13690 RepID=UPI0023A046AC|nr:NAD(P)/FAD-dependent oxidoreductase [Sphingomonas bacterium]